MKKNERIADLIKNRFGLATSAGEDMQGFDELANILNHRTHRRYLDTVSYTHLTLPTI